MNLVGSAAERGFKDDTKPFDFAASKDVGAIYFLPEHLLSKSSWQKQV